MYRGLGLPVRQSVGGQGCRGVDDAVRTLHGRRIEEGLRRGRGAHSAAGELAGRGTAAHCSFIAHRNSELGMNAIVSPSEDRSRGPKGLNGSGRAEVWAHVVCSRVWALLLCSTEWPGDP